MSDKPFDPTPAIERALRRIGDIVYPMGDMARVVITGVGSEPIMEGDEAALAKRIAAEELERALIEQGFAEEDF